MRSLTVWFLAVFLAGMILSAFTVLGPVEPPAEADLEMLILGSESVEDLVERADDIELYLAESPTFDGPRFLAGPEDRGLSTAEAGSVRSRWPTAAAPNRQRG